MASQIFSALAAGYPSRVIMNQLIRRYPQHRNTIELAEAAGYSSSQILRKLNKDEGNEDDYLTEHEKVQKRDKQQKKKAALQALGVLGTAGAIAAGGIGYATRNQAVRGQVLPPIQGQRPQLGGGGPTILQGGRRPQGPRGGGQLPAPQQKGLGYSPRSPQSPQGQSPAPQQPNAPIIPPYEHNAKKNVDLIRNIKEDKRVGQALGSGLGIAAVADALRDTLPRSKLSLLERAPGGLEKVLEDYQMSLQQQRSEGARQQALEKFNQLGKKPGLIDEEWERFIQQYPQMADDQIGQEQEQAKDLVEQVEDLQQSPQILQEARQQVQGEDVRPRTDSAAFDVRNDSSKEPKPLNPQSFYVPGYKYPGESAEDFANRKILHSLVNKGAKAILEGKSFLDFPINPEAIKARGGYSTAVDVLNFMGGIPNVYDPLLDEDEKQELYDGLMESGQKTFEGFRPSKGERPVHGALTTPSLVWNLLLSLEPKLATMKRPPAMKGMQRANGKEMGTMELKRMLTHSVYGVLSGRNISAELSDKIAKISKASAHVDAIAKAVKEGNRRKMDEEMERIVKDDAYFLDLMSQEIESMVLSSPFSEDKEDAKLAASIKSKATRKSNKKQKESNED